jgi:hypothetical protein
VLTKAERGPDDESFSDQDLISIQAAAVNIVRHLHVRQKETCDAATPAPQPVRRASGKGAQRRRKRRTKPRRGGWPLTKYISRELLRETRAKAGLLAFAGYRFTVFATARAPLGLTDSQAKRHIARSFARLGQALERNGHGYIGLNAYEKPIGGFLHGHALVHVRRECLLVVKRWADRFDERPPKSCEPVESVALHARHAVSSDLVYVLKQRRFNGPYERPGLPWQPSAPFAGTRVSFTKMARLIIEEAERRWPTSESPTPHLAASNPVARRDLKLARAA